MIILDTNVISEMMKSEPSIKVLDWLDRQEITQLFVTTITIAEISYGLDVLPKGKRKTALEVAFHTTLLEAFNYRILSFDEIAAHQYGKIMGQRKKTGHPLSILDGQICAIASAHDAAIATRNIRDFVDCDVELINPF
ncbi:MAG: type II toxin-antitoxin system VapC family toxin [Gammaproteobacteria bacterium]|nr:type II toxin-antitoxin system VapC family toxin [Gammaproteobacteria bacterium]